MPVSVSDHPYPVAKVKSEIVDVTDGLVTSVSFTKTHRVSLLFISNPNSRSVVVAVEWNDRNNAGSDTCRAGRRAIKPMEWKPQSSADNLMPGNKAT